MSIALGWLAVLAGFAGAPVPRVDGPEITYQFQIVEMRGLEWRGGGIPGLKPVTSRGGVTVWTAPRDFLKALPEGAGKQVLMAPRVTALSQAAAHITTRKDRPFVTQVAWRGETSSPRETTENVREGMAATVSGRCIDQGVLTQVVIEDTEVRSVHTLSLPNPAQARNDAAGEDCIIVIGEEIRVPHAGAVSDEFIVVGAGLVSLKGFACRDGSTEEMPNSTEAFCPAACHDRDSDPAVTQASLQPSDSDACCADEKAKSAQCPAMQGCPGARAGEKSTWTPSRSAQVQVPEIGRAEISGEWLIPRDEVLLIGFGPHTVADKDGKAVVRERLAMITAEEIALPTPTADTEPLGIPRIPQQVARSAGGSSLPLPSPSLPSRSLPQGVNADGSPAALPPLPDDAAADPAPGDSTEPRPSPQSRKQAKPATPEEKPAPKPSTSSDSKASKAAFTLPKGLFKQPLFPQLAFPNLQFMMPLRPFDMKLPFNQKLELELIGRVVADTDDASSSSDAD